MVKEITVTYYDPQFGSHQEYATFRRGQVDGQRWRDDDQVLVSRALNAALDMIAAQIEASR
jgi:hypothetical protein